MNTARTTLLRTLFILLGVLALVRSTVSKADTQWAHITAPGNAAYAGNSFGLNAGRGSVAYSYRIAKTEVTTSQWLEFVNTFSVQSDELNNTLRSATGYWPVDPDFFYPPSAPGNRYVARPTVANAEQVPVNSMTWRVAALYCNWLHHDKTDNWQTIQSGAYDTSTFGTAPDGSYTDQRTRSPGARYWIPSFDEWLKATHYDPAKDGTGGWWEQPNGTNTPLLSGLPGSGQTSTGIDDFSIARNIPTGAYSNVTTPWGLFDASGGAAEWTEDTEALFDTLVYRVYAGSTAGIPFTQIQDDLGFAGFQQYGPPSITSLAGLRVASVIPSPSTWFMGVVGLAGLLRRVRYSDHRCT